MNCRHRGRSTFGIACDHPLVLEFHWWTDASIEQVVEPNSSVSWGRYDAWMPSAELLRCPVVPATAARRDGATYVRSAITAELLLVLSASAPAGSSDYRRRCAVGVLRCRRRDSLSPEARITAGDEVYSGQAPVLGFLALARRRTGGICRVGCAPEPARLHDRRRYRSSPMTGSQSRWGWPSASSGSFPEHDAPPRSPGVLVAALLVPSIVIVVRPFAASAAGLSSAAGLRLASRRRRAPPVSCHRALMIAAVPAPLEAGLEVALSCSAERLVGPPWTARNSHVLGEPISWTGSGMAFMQGSRRRPHDRWQSGRVRVSRNARRAGRRSPVPPTPGQHRRDRWHPRPWVTELP